MDDFLHQFDFLKMAQWLCDHDEDDEGYRLTADIYDALGSAEKRAWFYTGNVIRENLRDLDYNVEIYERPRDIASAQMWVRDHVEGEKARERLLGLLNLLEGDKNLWIYESQ